MQLKSQISSDKTFILIVVLFLLLSSLILKKLVLPVVFMDINGPTPSYNISIDERSIDLIQKYNVKFDSIENRKSSWPSSSDSPLFNYLEMHQSSGFKLLHLSETSENNKLGLKLNVECNALNLIDFINFLETNITFGLIKNLSLKSKDEETNLIQVELILESF